MPASSTNGLTEWVARRERVVVLAGLGVTIALAWLYLFLGGGMGSTSGPNAMKMPDMAGMDMAGMGGGQPTGGLWGGTTLIIFAMWSVMMAAMMLPSAAPVILLYAGLARSRVSTAAFPPVGAFAGGYLLVWVAFSALATLAHVSLQHAALLSPVLRSTSTALAAVLLIAAGVYQFTPLKSSCLRQCRAPAQFLARHWRAGTAGALRLGVVHGGYCVGCCWALMGLLFVGGVMNLWWVAVLAAFILGEKTAFLGRPTGRIVSGAGLVAAGTVALVLM